jgi:hypothetical protein
MIWCHFNSNNVIYSAENKRDIEKDLKINIIGFGLRNPNKKFNHCSSTTKEVKNIN